MPRSQTHDCTDTTKKTVTFWYVDREGKKHFVTMAVREFIKALIPHIPDRNFKMIRHYGAYSRRS
ncbi:hypothetical protein C4E24_06145 [ANME-1 cluster archaeon AG-394-G21]|nr:hypothetical protein [ANME-1 cluster archaeon AG-394-G21]